MSNQLTKRLNDNLIIKYEGNVKPRKSYICIIEKLNTKLNTEVSINNVNTLIIKLDELYKSENRGLVDSIKYLVRKSGTDNFLNNELIILRLLLRVNFIQT